MERKREATACWKVIQKMRDQRVGVTTRAAFEGARTNFLTVPSGWVSKESQAVCHDGGSNDPQQNRICSPRVTCKCSLASTPPVIRSSHRPWSGGYSLSEVVEPAPADRSAMLFWVRPATPLGPF